MVNHKVEIKAYGRWFPASSKYFKNKQSALNFEKNLIRNNPILKKKTRIKLTGKINLWENFLLAYLTTINIIGFVMGLMVLI